MECKIRCGKCCIGVEYIYENLTPTQRDEVIRPRTKTCCMLTKDKLCLIQKKFGYEAKPDICKSHLCDR